MKKMLKFTVLVCLAVFAGVLAFSSCRTGSLTETPDISCIHTEVTDRAIAPTCTEAGLTEGKHCSKCNTVLVAQTSVAPLGHTVTTANPIAPTCTESGLTEGKYCTVCSNIIKKQEILPPMHTAEIDAGVLPTCTESGLSDGQHCSVCHEVITAQTVLPAKGHLYGDWIIIDQPTETENGTKRRVCKNCDDFETDIVAALSHDHNNWDVITLAAVAPTCTSTGLTEGKKCAGCGETYLAQNTIPANGHDYKNAVTPPTCSEKGYTTHTCHCGDSYVDSYVSAPGHSTVVDKAVMPTCYSTGLTEGSHCSRCDEVLVVQQTVELLDHSYVLKEVAGVSGVYAYFCERCFVEKNITVITYEDYGAVGDGVTDDYEAIRKAHNAANYYNLPVEGKADATYYIGVIPETITVKTDTDWNGATFIFDDYQIAYDSALRKVNVFTVASDTKAKSVSVPSNLALNGLSKGQTNIGFAPGEACMLLIVNSGEKINKRYGVNSNSGDNKQEIILVDEHGNVDTSTPIQYDYSAITAITKYSIKDKGISVGNAKIITRVPDPKTQNPDFDNSNGAFYSRGISVQRSNTRIYGIEHSIVGEDMTVEIDRNGDGVIDKWGADKSYGVTYDGFFNFRYCYGVTFEDSTVQGHQAYSFWQGDSRNEVGNYDIYARYCVDIAFKNLTQYENKETGEVITNRFMYHGIMGSVYCRNFLIEGCYLDRFDSHAGLYNATITDSTLGFGILVIGAGTLHIEDTTRVSGNAFITLRTDYNCIFDGDVVIKDCRMHSEVTSIISGRWIEFYNGLPNQITKSVTIDGLIADTNKICIFNVSGATVAALTNSTNPLYIPDYVKVYGITRPDGTDVGVDVSKYNDAFTTVEVDIHLHSWSEGEILKEASANTCQTGVIKYVCTDPQCDATREGIIRSDKIHTSLQSSISGDGNIVYACPDCGCSYTPNSSYVMNGKNHNAMEGVSNSGNYTTVSGTENPIINENGEYELLKKSTGDAKQFQLWLPSKTYTLDDLSDDNDAIGFLSFKMNAYVDNGVSFKLVDIKSNEGSDRWKANGCIVDDFFKISSPTVTSGKTYVSVTGWDGLILKTVDITDKADKFTGWIDVKILIVLENDTVILHYYIDDEYVGAKSRTLTTKTDSISGVYISGKTATENSGLILADVAFGCSFGKRDSD